LCVSRACGLCVSRACGLCVSRACGLCVSRACGVELVVYEHFEVLVGLPSKCMAHAHVLHKKVSTPLSASQAVILIWFDTIFAFHVKLHAYANWGVNTQQRTHKYQREASVITVMYNYFGYSAFPKMATAFCKCFGHFQWDNVGPVIDHGVNEGLKRPVNLKEIASVDTSTIAAFTTELKEPFTNVFTKYRRLFPGIDAESLMIGTVWHSVDHTNMAWNMRDVLWLDTSDEKYGHLAECGRFVRCGFVDDLPGSSLGGWLPWLCWPRKFNMKKKADFYREVYHEAKKIDQRQADVMDTCIIK